MNDGYSVDMVRLSVRVDCLEAEVFLNSFSMETAVDYWQDFSAKNFRHNWRFVQESVFNVGMPDGSFWIGYCHNMEKPSDKYLMVIEYNPNKVFVDGYLEMILKRFFRSPDVIIKSVDIAHDMKVNIRDIIVGKDCKKLKKTFDYGGDNKTYYIGSGNGRIKIYNKAREMGFEGIELTRYEVSVETNLYLGLYHLFNDSMLNLEPVYIMSKNDYYDSLDGTDRALVYAIQNGFPVEELPRKKKEKIKKILSECAGNTIESVGFVKAFHNYFSILNDLIVSK